MAIEAPSCGWRTGRHWMVVERRLVFEKKIAGKAEHHRTSTIGFLGI